MGAKSSGDGGDEAQTGPSFPSLSGLIKHTARRAAPLRQIPGDYSALRGEQLVDGLDTGAMGP